MHAIALPEVAAQAQGSRCTVCGKPLEPVTEPAAAGSGIPDLPVDVSGFPSIIALPIRHYFLEPRPRLRLWAACDIVELLLRLVVAAGLADIRRRGEPPAKLIRAIAPRIDCPTLGKWRAMAEAVVAHLGGPDCLLPEFVALVREQIVPLLDTPRGQKPRPENAFSRLRNALAHNGGVAVTRKKAEQLLSVWDPELRKLIDALGWMTDVQLVVRTPAGYGVFRGPASQPADYPVTDRALDRQLAAGFASGKEVLLVRDGVVMALWPLAVYGAPHAPGGEDVPNSKPVSQIYTRRGEVELEFTPLGSEQVCQSEVNGPALAAFLAYFRVDQEQTGPRGKPLAVRGFHKEIRKDSDRLVGREEQLACVRAMLGAPDQRVLWLWGTAGSGKSYLVARIAAELLGLCDELGEHEQTVRAIREGTLVLPYRFKAGDTRCSREQFLQYAVERLLGWEGLGVADAWAAQKKKGPLAQLNWLLYRAGRCGRVLFILDGLDEIAERDPKFAKDVVLGLAFPGVTWLCAGRPEPVLREAFGAAACRHVFDGGLPEMTEGEIYEMIIEKIGAHRDRLLCNDHEKGGRNENAFVSLVKDKAKGLPIYVKYVIADVLANRFDVLDAATSLPPSLGEYHERQLQRHVGGDRDLIRIPLHALLAVAMEPLCEEALAELLEEWHLPVQDEEGQALILRVLADSATVIRRAPTAEGKQGFTLFHHSYRQHVLESRSVWRTVQGARQVFHALAAKWQAVSGPLHGYLVRKLAYHFLDLDDPEGLVERFLAAGPDNPLWPGVAEALVARLPRIQAYEMRAGESRADGPDYASYRGALEREVPAARAIRLLSDAGTESAADMLADLLERAFPFGGWVAEHCAAAVIMAVAHCSTGRRIQALLRLNTHLTSGTSGNLSSDYVAQAAALCESHDHALRPFVLTQLAVRRPAEQGLALCAEARTLAERQADPMMRWEAYYNQGRWLKVCWRFAEAEQVLDQCVAVFTPADEPVRMLWALEKRAICRYRTGRFEAAARDLMQCVPILDRLPRASVHARQDEQIGWLLTHCGRPEQGLLLLEHAFNAFKAMKRKEYVRSLCKLVNGAIDTGRGQDVARFESALRKGIEQHMANISWYADLWAMLTMARLIGRDSARREEAARWLADANAVIEEKQVAGYRVAAGHYEAELARDDGRDEDALRSAQAAYELAEQLGDGIQRPYIADLLARIAEAGGNTDEARHWRDRVGQDRALWRCEETLELLTSGEGGIR